MGELIDRSGEHGVKEIVMGMSHRGRLNVLVNILGKLPSKLFSEFEDQHHREHATGDVKYHQGFSSNIRTTGGLVHLALAFNPSHLEIVAPVVEGSVRARQWRRRDSGGNEVMPVQIHGDAAFSGQGQRVIASLVCIQIAIGLAAIPTQRIAGEGFEDLRFKQGPGFNIWGCLAILR